MTNFMFYLYKRLFVQQYGRAEMMDILTRKVLKSIARSTGARLHTNRWLRTLDFLYRSTGVNSEHMPEELAAFREALPANLMRYVGSHATSVHRTLLILKYLDHKIGACEDLAEHANQVISEFVQRNDEVWFGEAMHKFGIQRADCGHYTSTLHNFVGNAATHNEYSTACSACAAQAVDSGVRSEHDGTYFMAMYVVQVHNPHGTRWMDRRTQGIVYSDRYQRWHTPDWTPHANLIEGYHSSKNRGFTLIESPWFKRHRRAFGIELEIQSGSGTNTLAAAGKVHDVLNPSGLKGEYCFFERDGSIGEGFELVTQPAGLDVHREKLGLFLANEDLKRGLRSHEGGNCGLHVHVGREYVTQAQIYRLQSFLNDVRNEGLIKKISRRYGNSYARMRPEMAKLSPIGKSTGERYEALNVTNRNTIEFRIFRGSLKYESVMAALEFVDSLLTFCMPGQTSIMDFNAIGFRRFITRIENSPDTKFLRTYLKLNQQNDAEHRLAA